MIKENDFGSVTDVYTYLKEGFKDICGGLALEVICCNFFAVSATGYVRKKSRVYAVQYRIRDHALYCRLSFQ